MSEIWLHCPAGIPDPGGDRKNRQKESFLEIGVDMPAAPFKAIPSAQHRKQDQMPVPGPLANYIYYLLINKHYSCQEVKSYAWYFGDVAA